MIQATRGYQRIVELANTYSQEFRAAPERWIQRVAYELNQEDRAWGLSGQLADPTTVSHDELCYGTQVVRVVSGVGGVHPTPTWQYVDRQAVWVQPRGVPGQMIQSVDVGDEDDYVAELTRVENTVTQLIGALHAHTDQIGALQKAQAQAQRKFLDGLEQQFIRFDTTMQQVIKSNQRGMWQRFRRWVRGETHGK